jgi:hypothetical protein
MNQSQQGSQHGQKKWHRFNSMREGKIDLGDFNGDGYSDLLLESWRKYNKIKRISRPLINTNQVILM